jgi:hypothetical protein
MSIDFGSLQDWLTAMDFHPQKRAEYVPQEQEFPYGNSVGLIAPPDAGKTCVLAGTFRRAQQKVKETKDTDTPFYCRVLEAGSNIHQDISNLTRGIFPAKTRSYLGFRSSPGLLLEQKKFAAASIPLTGRIFGREFRPRKQLWHKLLQLKACDLPGETLTQVMWQIRALTKDKMQTARDVIEHALAEMLEIDAAIFITKASEVLGFGEQIEKPVDITGNIDPDVPLTRMAEWILSTKMQRSERLKKIFVAITAWDKLAPRAEKLGINLLDPFIGKQHMENFVANCYPQFYAAIHSYVRDEDIEYYPLYYQTVKENGREVLFEDEVAYYDEHRVLQYHKVRRPHIMVKSLEDPRNRSIWDGVGKIEWSYNGFGRLLDDMMTLAEAR